MRLSEEARSGRMAGLHEHSIRIWTFSNLEVLGGATVVVVVAIRILVPLKHGSQFANDSYAFDAS